MPKNIKLEHMARMFPFEFFDELSEQLSGYIINNPVFMLDKVIDREKTNRKKVYHDNKKSRSLNTLTENNLIDVEPFGELLILELCTPTKDVDLFIKNKQKRSLIPLTFLVGQLYDSAGQPVFATDVTEGTIARIPEVLWDDPNLLLATISFSTDGNDEPEVGVIKIPPKIEEKLFEGTDSDETSE